MSRCEKILNEQVKSLRAKNEELHTANCQQLCDIADLKMEAIEAKRRIAELEKCLNGLRFSSGVTAKMLKARKIRIVELELANTCLQQEAGERDDLNAELSAENDIIKTNIQHLGVEIKAERKLWLAKIAEIKKKN